MHGHLEIGVVAPANHLIGRTCGPVAQIGILPAADAENRLLGRHVEITAHVIEIAHPRHQTAAAVDYHHTPRPLRRTQAGNPRPETGRPGLVEQRLVTAAENAPVEQRGVLLPIPLQQRIDQGMDLLLGLERLAEINRLKGDAALQQLL